MLTLKQIKKDIQFNRELAGLIDILKGIASSHFRRLQAKREYFSRFNRSLDSIFETVSVIKSGHPFIKGVTPPAKTGIVMITSDEGFLGELNNAVINAGLSLRQEQDELIILGERGAHFLEELKESFLYFPGIPEEIEQTQIESLRDYLAQQYLKKRFGKVVIVYPKFISFSLQEVKIKQLLPYAREAGSGIHNPLPGILVEPSEERVIDYLVRLWMAQEIYDIFWDSKLSELASRTLHLEGSSQVISELSRKLQFFHLRIIHQISDKNIREIFASRLIK